MPDYLFPHPNAGWQYRRKVPKALWDIVSAASGSSTLKACPRAQALMEARKLAVAHDTTIARWGGLSAAERADIAATVDGNNGSGLPLHDLAAALRNA